jgi:Glycosyl transferase family 2
MAGGAERQKNYRDYIDGAVGFDDVLINNFNHAKYLTRAMDSALSQTYLATEAVVVDEGLAEDNFIDKSLRSLRSSKNSGEASAFNAGVAHSTLQNSWAFLDSDDYLPYESQKVGKVFARVGLQERPMMVQRAVMRRNHRPNDRTGFWQHASVRLQRLSVRLQIPLYRICCRTDQPHFDKTQVCPPAISIAGFRPSGHRRTTWCLKVEQ